ncbi:hypothetical protein HZC35_07885 [Candidatus Saganbacteria bacterium]|nr:hypothetical protein [Candidatus Saganbacteria bacterium]
MIWLIVSGLIAAATGIMMLVSDVMFFNFSEVTDRVVFDLDKAIRPYRIIAGWVLVLAAVILALMAFAYAEYRQLHFVWPVALLFGVLFIFMLAGLDLLSKFANVVIFPTKDRVRGFCKVMGVILLIAGAYILITAYLIR